MIICKKLNVRVKIFALSELSVLTGIGGVTVPVNEEMSSVQNLYRREAGLGSIGLCSLIGQLLLRSGAGARDEVQKKNPTMLSWNLHLLACFEALMSKKSRDALWGKFRGMNVNLFSSCQYFFYRLVVHVILFPLLCKAQKSKKEKNK